MNDPSALNVNVPCASSGMPATVIAARVSGLLSASRVVGEDAGGGRSSSASPLLVSE